MKRPNFDVVHSAIGGRGLSLSLQHWGFDTMAKKKPTCPQCNSKEVIPIVFGFPSPEMFESSDHGELKLGGCCVEIDDPEWHCKDCEYEW